MMSMKLIGFGNIASRLFTFYNVFVMAQDNGVLQGQCPQSSSSMLLQKHFGPGTSKLIQDDLETTAKPVPRWHPDCGNVEARAMFKVSCVFLGATSAHGMASFLLF